MGGRKEHDPPDYREKGNYVLFGGSGTRDFWRTVKNRIGETGPVLISSLLQFRREKPATGDRKLGACDQKKEKKGD